MRTSACRVRLAAERPGRGREMGSEVSAGFTVGWGTLSLINAALAQTKDRSGLLWWFISDSILEGR